MKRIKLSGPADADYGIKLFLNNYPAVSGILKHRFNDFIVNEVDLNDEIVIQKDNSIKQQDESIDKSQSLDDALVKILEVIPPDQISEIKNLINKKSDKSVASIQILDKYHRSIIHNLAKSFLDLNTTTNADNTIIFERRTGKGNNRINWKDKGGEFLEFTMKKENKDTMEAIDILANFVRRPVKTFNFAGTKDKRGITTQLVTGHKILAENMMNLNSKLIGIQLGDFRYRKSRIELGDLNGNQFTITIRNLVPPDTNLVNNSLLSLKENGFINYFGMQRFGTHSIPTFSAGISMLKENWKEAIDLILQPKLEDNEKITAARKAWMDDNDAKKALGLFPRRCVAERSILGFFAKTKRTNDLLGAILSIPRNLRLLYVHSYQSLVFNEMATERIRLYGNKLQIGDLVDVSGYLPELNQAESNQDSKTHHVHVIADESDLQKYTIEDLVLPLPGYDVKFPKNAMLEAYKTFMGKHGFDPLDMRRKQKDFSLPGSYRKVFVKPKSFKWQLASYDDLDADIHVSTLVTDHQTSTGKFLAVVLEFILPTSAYATMCLRELLKSETSSVFHHQLSVATADEENDVVKE